MLIQETNALGLIEAEPARALRPGTGYRLRIVVCTYNRPVLLGQCLEHLLNLEAQNYQVEIIVVDNDPASGQSGPVVRHYQGLSRSFEIRYIAEYQPGISYARTRGAKAALSGEPESVWPDLIIAYIDDDVVVPPNWLVQIMTPFEDKQVMCVSGRTLPLELRTPAQLLFEKYGGLTRPNPYGRFDRAFFDSIKGQAVPTWELGGTANLAVRATALAAIDFFDPTLSNVCEDLFMFYELLERGLVCVYKPEALVYHSHRTKMSELRQQIFRYSYGHVSYHLHTLFKYSDRRVFAHLLYKLPRHQLGKLYRRLRGDNRDYPVSLLVIELAGNLYGPVAYLKAVVQNCRRKA